MKKLAILGLTLILGLGLLVGCSGGNGDDTTTSEVPTTEDGKRILKFDAFEGGNGTGVLDALIEGFEEANPDVHVELRAEKDLPSVLNKENATGEYSDVVYYNLGQPSLYTETQLNTNQVLEITDVLEEIDIHEDYANSKVVNYYGDGKAYLLPLKTTPAGFFYNTELIGEGKKYELPTTWNEFWELGNQAKADGISLFTYPTEGYFDNTLNALLMQAGGSELLDTVLAYGENVWDTEGAKQATDIIAKLVSSDYLYPDTVSNSLSGNFTVNQQAVIDGKALFMPNGDWIVGEMAATTPEEGFHWGLLTIPAMEEGGERYVGTMTEQVWIPAQAKNVEDAKAFLKFIYSEEGVAIMQEYGNIVPTSDYIERIDTMEDGYAKEFFSAFKTATPAFGAFAAYNAEALPDVDRYAVVFGTINDLATGETTVEEYRAALNEAWAQFAANPVGK